MSLRHLDYHLIYPIIKKGIKDYVGTKIAVVGISGGIDSALTATLCVQALGQENVLGILLPCGSQSDIKDSLNLVKQLGIKHEVVDIEPIVSQYKMFSNSLVLANIMSRTRMTVLYAFANLNNGLVVGTTNKSEMAIGYFTKHGDGGVDFEPIAELYKTEVWELSKILGVPLEIITKTPTAGLWAGQTDEQEMGFSYRELDNYLQGEEVGDDVKEQIEQLIKTSEHKRHLPPTIKVI